MAKKTEELWILKRHCNVDFSMLELCLENESCRTDKEFLKQRKDDFLKNCKKIKYLDHIEYNAMMTRYNNLVGKYEK